MNRPSIVLGPDTLARCAELRSDLLTSAQADLLATQRNCMQRRKGAQPCDKILTSTAHACEECLVTRHRQAAGAPHERRN